MFFPFVISMFINLTYNVFFLFSQYIPYCKPYPCNYDMNIPLLFKYNIPFIIRFFIIFTPSHLKTQIHCINTVGWMKYEYLLPSCSLKSCYIIYNIKINIEFPFSQYDATKFTQRHWRFANKLVMWFKFSYHEHIFVSCTYLWNLSGGLDDNSSLFSEFVSNSTAAWSLFNENTDICNMSRMSPCTRCNFSLMLQQPTVIAYGFYMHTNK